MSCRRPAPVISLARFRLGASSSVRQSPAKPAGSARRYAGRALHRSNSLISARACVSGARPRTRTGAWAGANAGPMRREDRSAGTAGRDPARPARADARARFDFGSVLTRGGFRTLVLTSGIRSGALMLYPRPTSSPGNLGPLGSVLTRGLRTLLSPGAPRVRTPHSLVARSSKGSDPALSCRQELQGFGLRTLLSPGAPRVRTPHSGNCRGRQ